MVGFATYYTIELWSGYILLGRYWHNNR